METVIISSKLKLGHNVYHIRAKLFVTVMLSMKPSLLLVCYIGNKFVYSKVQKNSGYDHQTDYAKYLDCNINYFLI